MDAHGDDKPTNEPAMLRASWLIVDGSPTTAATTSLVANGHQKRSAFGDGLKQRRVVVGTEDNVNDKVSPLGEDGDHCAQKTAASTQPKNWSADERMHIAKSDTCPTTASHLGQVGND